MISTDFAPNEYKEDAFLALMLLFQPWRWRRGREGHNLKRRLRARFFPPDSHISLYFSGRGALYQYIRHLNLKPKDEVLVQAFTCEAVVLPLLAQEVRPVYVDISDTDFSMNYDDLVKKYSPRARALILQHTFGITPRERKKILAFAREKNLQVIEDVAHGFDPAVFTSRFTSTILMSFGRSKVFSSVFGGAIIVRNKKEKEAMKESEKQLPNASNLILLQMLLYKIATFLIKATYHIGIGKMLHVVFKKVNLLIPEISKKEKNGSFDSFFLRTYPNVAALFMLKQLDRFNDVIRERKRIVQFYNKELLSNHMNLRHIPYEGALIRYPYLSQDRDSIKKTAQYKDVYLGTWYSQVVAPDELDLYKVEYVKGSCPVAERLSREILNLPTHVTKKEAREVVKIVERT